MREREREIRWELIQVSLIARNTERNTQKTHEQRHQNREKEIKNKIKRKKREKNTGKFKALNKCDHEWCWTALCANNGSEAKQEKR